MLLKRTHYPAYFYNGVLYQVYLSTTRPKLGYIPISNSYCLMSYIPCLP